MLHKILRFLFGKNVTNCARLQRWKFLAHAQKYWGVGLFFTHQ